ncbi:acyl-CoA thioesterase II [Oceanicoccus sp. KOV_DT_Chl]|uniref:acyl-CoA thioesterase n=1 Tax=Oceanicoccus sp. KOV_DT_Chl TaxID=1904639 RepID=UPI000C7B0EB7|nr:acyl-CoA thioesterase II [Oceanicoccus sp. KOV_DT_Chl]
MAAKAAVEKLIQSFQLEKIAADHYQGRSDESFIERIYGGQVVAQAVSASQHSITNNFQLHSFHSHFLRPGNPKKPVDYKVEALRDGRSFSTRRITALQADKAIFLATLSYQVEEEGYDYQAQMPAVANPEQLITDRELFKAVLPDSGYGWPIEFRQCDPMDFSDPQAKSASAYVWFKAAAEVGDDPHLNQQLLAYASDNPILSAVLRPLGFTPFSPTVATATLDHSIWYHRPFRIDDWLLYEIHGESVSAGRGISRGKIFNQRGELVASAMQEGLVRRV